MKKLTPKDSIQPINTQAEKKNFSFGGPFSSFCEEWMQHLTDSETLLLAVLVNRAREKSYAYCSDSSLMESMNWKKTKLLRNLALLEQKKLIFRYSFFISKKDGSKRRIIPFTEALRYAKDILPKSKAKPEIKGAILRFCSLYTKTQVTDITQGPISRIPEFGTPFCKSLETLNVPFFGYPNSGPSSAPNTGLVKEKKIKDNILLLTSSLPESASESSEEEEFSRIEREMREEGFSAEQIEVGRKFFSAFHEEVSSKRYPSSYIKSSVKRGFAVDRLRGLASPNDQEDDPAPPLPNQEQNRALAAHAVQKLAALPRGYRVSLGENCVHFSWPRGSSVVSLGDTNFACKLEAHVSQIENLSRSPSEASAVGEGPTIGEPLLRFAAKTETATANGSANGPRKPSKGVRSAQNASRVSYAYAEELEPYAAFKSVWASSPPKA